MNAAGFVERNKVFIFGLFGLVLGTINGYIIAAMI
jgi:hypothetical protein